MGLGLFASVRYMSGRDALAEMESRLCPLGDLIVSRSSSASGCAIFAILPFKSCSFNSWTRLATTIPSKAIKNPFFWLVSFNLIIVSQNSDKWYLKSGISGVKA